MEDPLESLRALCLALPEATERLSHGSPAWFVRDKKTFVTPTRRPTTAPEGGASRRR